MVEENMQSNERHLLDWDRPRLKEIAKRQLEGRWTTPVLALLVMGFVLGIIYGVNLFPTLKESFIKSYNEVLQRASIEFDEDSDYLDMELNLPSQTMSSQDYEKEADELISLTLKDFVFQIIMALLTAVFAVPFIKIFVTLSRTREKVKFTDYMGSFSGTGKFCLAGLWKFLWRNIWLLIPSAIVLFASYWNLKIMAQIVEEGLIFNSQTLLCTSLVSLASIASSVIAVIKDLEYRYMYNVIAENPSISVRKALTLSKKITNGYKLKLFVFDLSYLGWYMLCVIAFPVFLYVFPYMNMADLNAYHVIKNNAIVNGLVKEEDF